MSTAFDFDHCAVGYDATIYGGQVMETCGDCTIRELFKALIKSQAQ
jgi:hypothetical protein